MYLESSIEVLQGCLGNQDAAPGGGDVPAMLGSQVRNYIFQLFILPVLRFIMETLLKMGILQFTTTVYWIRVVLFLFPFMHTMGKIMFLMYLPATNLFLSEPTDLCSHE